MVLKERMGSMCFLAQPGHTTGSTPEMLAGGRQCWLLRASVLSVQRVYYSPGWVVASLSKDGCQQMDLASETLQALHHATPDFDRYETCWMYVENVDRRSAQA